MCWQLIILCLAVVVNCNLEVISNLEPVGASLTHLCLSNQNLTRMSGLSSLRQLRHLYLQQNRISRIEGLERYLCHGFRELTWLDNVYFVTEFSCRKLKTLWLYDNCITRVENLGFCTDLRELWLQVREHRAIFSIRNYRTS